MANMKETLENDPLPGKILYIFRIHWNFRSPLL
jgi:hypothetical protein